MTTTAIQVPMLIESASFPNSPGVYTVHTSDGRSVLYVGKATTQTIQQRWQRQHLYPRAGGSALRRSLGVHLGLGPEKLKRPARYYPAEVETEITTYLRRCHIVFYRLSDPVEIAAQEGHLIRTLRPLLNVQRA